MPDIVVRQSAAANITLQSNSTQVVLQTAAPNTVVLQTTGSSYVLPPATANSLGGIIVGDNLTINANGLLSATAGAGVNSFNNRTGNVTLLANDVSAIGDTLYFPLSSNAIIKSGTTNVPLTFFNYSGNGTQYQAQMYGIGKTQSTPNAGYGGNTTSINYVGMIESGSNVGLPVFGSYSLTPLRTDGFAAVQSEMMTSGFQTTARYANGTDYNQIYCLITSQRISFGFYGNRGATAIFSEFYFDTDGGTFFCVLTALNNANPAQNEVLTRSAADKLYEKIVRRN